VQAAPVSYFTTPLAVRGRGHSGALVVRGLSSKAVDDEIAVLGNMKFARLA
jgi:hypothetical protein